MLSVERDAGAVEKNDEKVVCEGKCWSSTSHDVTEDENVTEPVY